MAWNQPTEKKEESPKRTKTRRGVWLGAAVLAAVLAAVVVALSGGGGGETEEPGGGKPLIADAARPRPPTAPAARPPTAARPASAPRPAGPTNVVLLTKNVKPPTVLGCNYYECVSGGRPLFTKPIFTNSAENIIGGLLSARPGERFVPVELGEDFDSDFAESMKTPIVAGEDDSQDVVVVKEAVARAKELIAAGMENGQKPSEVVMSMRDEMNKVADYRDLLQEDFDALKETGTAAEIEAYLKEANQLLDEFGAARLDLPEDEVEEINRRLSGAGK